MKKLSNEQHRILVLLKDNKPLSKNDLSARLSSLQKMISLRLIKQSCKYGTKESYSNEEERIKYTITETGKKRLSTYPA
ncbi:hypothetical protein [Photobacterium leiognathi]|uniref:hypothetical protein n=1 Tax=Photobacterium leiognathi TaxID=553611 RepID=UPI0029826857|nr:hypothetical protein [Photobacterium leiognathi]